MEDNGLRAKLAAKLMSLMEDVGKMEKDGYNSHSKYGFISHEQLSTRLRGLLPKHKLIIIPSAEDVEETHNMVTVKGVEKELVRTVLKIRMNVIDVETGYSESFYSVGADQDYGGKSCGQAFTEGVKRWLFKALSITSSDDIDPDSKTDEKIKSYPHTKRGFMQMLLDAGYKKDEVPAIAKDHLGDNPTDADVDKWFKEHGYNAIEVEFNHG